MTEKQESLVRFLGMAKKLREEHGRILEALEKSQRDVAFYQPFFQKAQQIETALKKGYAPTPSFTPDFLGNQNYLEAIRSLIVLSVFAKWNRSKKPSTLREIYGDVKARIRNLIETGRWNAKRWKPPGKRTVDRRVNECADPKFYKPGEPTRIIAVRAGHYIPNPKLFEPPMELKST